MIDVHCSSGGRHEWKLAPDELAALCTKCPAHLEFDEVELLLNAAMQLTADEAKEAGRSFKREAQFAADGFDFYAEREYRSRAVRQFDYARRWRGDTEGGK